MSNLATMYLLGTGVPRDPQMRSSGSGALQRAAMCKACTPLR